MPIKIEAFHFFTPLNVVLRRKMKIDWITYVVYVGSQM